MPSVPCVMIDTIDWDTLLADHVLGPKILEYLDDDLCSAEYLGSN